jgi:peptidoglycan-N-acetylglucosamine deacetylase
MSYGGLIDGSAGVLAAGFLAYAVRGRTASVFGPSVSHGDRARRSLALTFDDGPSESTPALLDLLSKHEVPGTFFMCGQNVERLPEVAREVAARGHEIGNHSQTHPYFHLRTPGGIYQEISKAQEMIAKYTGKRPVLFRAPYGVRWFGLREAQRDLALMGVMWTVIGRDWKWPAPRIARLLLRRPSNGDILCLHDGRGLQKNPDIRVTLDALEVAIPELKRLGFQFETVSQLLRPVAL